MRNLNGTHGTCATYADAIEKTGRWKPTNVGRAGSGVYFWAYEKNPVYARKFAVMWWEFVSKSGLYAREPAPGCAVLYVNILVPEQSYLDFNEPGVEEALNEAVAMAVMGMKPDESMKPEVIHKVYEHLVLALEAELGVTFDVVKARVSPPKGALKEKNILGNPNCYVVRNGCERIALTHRETVGGDKQVAA